MTREHKLALIVGFSLILLVGVLISDHLSRARQARIASVGPKETLVADANVPAASDPLRTLETLTPPPQPEGAPPRVAAVPTSGNSGAGQGNGNPQTVAAAPRDTSVLVDTLGNDSRTVAATTPNDGSLEATIIRQGGSIKKDAKGNNIFTLPAAAEATTSKTAGVHATNEPAPKRFATSPIDFGPSMTVANTQAKAAAAKPTTETVQVHPVQKGETLFKIADKYYGNGHMWRDLAKYNNVQDQDGVVRIGTKLRIPSRDTLLGKVTAPDQKTATSPVPPARTTPSPSREVAPPRPMTIQLASYTVKKGETLGVISQKVLGSSKRWHEIADLNKIDDEDSIAAGTVLKVPPMRG